MKRYAVQDPDAVFIAGKRVPDDRTILLSDEEARYELLAGTIKPAADTSAEPPRRARRDSEG